MPTPTENIQGYTVSVVFFLPQKVDVLNNLIFFIHNASFSRS